MESAATNNEALEVLKGKAAASIRAALGSSDDLARLLSAILTGRRPPKFSRRMFTRTEVLRIVRAASQELMHRFMDANAEEIASASGGRDQSNRILDLVDRMDMWSLRKLQVGREAPRFDEIKDEPASRGRQKVVILRLDSYEGEDTYLYCGDENQDFMYCVVSVGSNRAASVIDSSYRSYEEAIESWPEAAVRGLDRD